MVELHDRLSSRWQQSLQSTPRAVAHVARNGEGHVYRFYRLFVLILQREVNKAARGVKVRFERTSGTRWKCLESFSMTSP